MSRTIHKPWLKDYIQEMLTGNGNESMGSNTNISKVPRIVQVMSCHENTRSILISDTEYYIHVFFSKECFEQLFNLYTAESLKYSQVKLTDYFITTVVQSTGYTDIHQLNISKVTLPLAIFCSKISYLGANDCEIINNPTALNYCKALQSIYKRFKYQSLVEILGSKQFPIQKRLPDWEGEFISDLSLEANLSYLTEESLKEPEDQLRIIRSLNSFDYVHAVHSLPALRSDEYGEKLISTSQPRSHSSLATRSMANNISAPTVHSTHLEGDSWAGTMREDDPYDSDKPPTQLSFPTTTLPALLPSGSARNARYQYYSETQVDGTEVQCYSETQVDGSEMQTYSETQVDGSALEMIDCDFLPSPSDEIQSQQITFNQFTMIETQHSNEVEILDTDSRPIVNNEITEGNNIRHPSINDTLRNKLLQLETNNNVALANLFPFQQEYTQTSSTSETFPIPERSSQQQSALSETEIATLPETASVGRPFNHNDPSAFYHTQQYITQEDRGDLQEWYSSQSCEMPPVPISIHSPTICVVDPCNIPIATKGSQKKDTPQTMLTQQASATTDNVTSNHSTGESESRRRDANQQSTANSRMSDAIAAPAAVASTLHLVNEKIINFIGDIHLSQQTTVSRFPIPTPHIILNPPPRPAKPAIHSQPDSQIFSYVEEDPTITRQQQHSQQSNHSQQHQYSPVAFINDGVNHQVVHFKKLRNGKNVPTFPCLSSPSYSKVKFTNLYTSITFIVLQCMISMDPDHSKYIGRRIRKKFTHSDYEGTVVSYRSPYYRIHYDDGDSEQLPLQELEKWILPLHICEVEDIDETMTQPQIVKSNTIATIEDTAVAAVSDAEPHNHNLRRTRQSSSSLETTQDTSSSNSNNTVNNFNSNVVARKKRIIINSTTATLYAQESNTIPEEDNEEDEIEYSENEQQQHQQQHQHEELNIEATPRTYKRSVDELLNSNNSSYNQINAAYNISFHLPSSYALPQRHIPQHRPNNLSSKTSDRRQLQIQSNNNSSSIVLPPPRSVSSTTTHRNSGVSIPQPLLIPQEFKTSRRKHEQFKNTPEDYAGLTKDQIVIICKGNKNEEKKLLYLNKLHKKLVEMRNHKIK